MEKSACIEMIFTEFDFYDRFAVAKKAGFKYVEFWTWDDKDLDKIVSACKENDLNIASISGDKDYSLVDLNHVEPYIEWIGKSIEAAKKLSCKYLVIHSNALGEGGLVVDHYREISDFEKFGVMIKTLGRLAPMAKEADMTLVLEALNICTDHEGNFLAYTKDAVSAVKIVGSPHIKILYDIYHMQLNEGGIIDSIRDFYKYIGYIHVADAPGRMEPGTGEINYGIIFKTLQEVGYSGPIGFELSPSKSSEEVAQELINIY
jgi:hydroxypyruvate isomerase